MTDNPEINPLRFRDAGLVIQMWLGIVILKTP